MSEYSKSAQNQPLYDVIIAGAGPVGLFLSCELALAGCTVLVLEKSEDPHSPLKQLPFGIRGLSAPTIEAFYRRGLLPGLQLHTRMKNPHASAVQQGARRQVGHFAGIPFHEGDVDKSTWNRLPKSPDTNLISEIGEIETVLSRRAKDLGVNIKQGHGVVACQQSTDGVLVDTGEQTFEGKWLVGCDGARSAVRKAGGFEFAGTEPEFTGYSAQVDLADPDKLRPGRNVTGRGMYLQSQPGYLLLQDFDAGAFHSAGKQPTREHIQDLLRLISDTDVTINTLHVATTWTDRTRQATVYRNGRILLAGDAAHIHSPLGGQGLNLGLGDAMNLGWKLAATINQTAPTGLLDTYHDERHPVGAQVLDWSRAQVAIMKPSPQSRALNTIFRELLNTRDGATYMAARVWGIFTRYDVGHEHRLAGCSVPNFELEDGRTVGELMADGKGVLLDFDANEALRYWSQAYGDRIKYISTRTDHSTSIRALLIRPDGIVAWGCDNNVNPDELQTAADRWFEPVGQVTQWFK